MREPRTIIRLFACCLASLLMVACTQGGAADPDTSALGSNDDDLSTISTDAGSASASSANASATTSPPTTTTPPTTAPPATPVSVAAVDVPPAGFADLYESASEVATSSDGSYALIAGSRQDTPGAPWQALVWRVDDGARAEPVILDNAGGSSSGAWGIAVSAEKVAVVGYVITGAAQQGAVWRSNDGGTTFDSPTLLSGDIESLAGVAFTDNGLIAHGTRQAPGERPAPILAIEDGDGFTTSIVEGPDQRGIVETRAYGNKVFLSGWSTEDNTYRSRLWTSDDGGQTLAEVDTPFDRHEYIGPVAFDGSGYVVASRGNERAPMTLMHSPDGVTWTENTVAATYPDDYPFQTVSVGGGTVLPFDGYYHTSASSGFGALVALALDGRGTVTNVGFDSPYATDNPRPFRIGDTVFALMDTERSFAIFRKAEPEYIETSAPSAVGPLDGSVDLYQLASRIVAVATAWPTVSFDGDRKKRSSTNVRSVSDGEAFSIAAPDALPGEPTALSANGDLQVAIEAGADDPGDVDGARWIGGTTASIRTGDGGWSAPELILSGPGGDNINDVAPLGPGFVAVGTRSVRQESGIDDYDPIVLEFLEGQWNSAQLTGFEGSSAGLSWVASDSTSGLALAFGTESLPDRSVPFILSRAADGSWSRIQLPGADTTLAFSDASIDDGQFLILANHPNGYTLFTSTDGLNFQSEPITFEDPFRVSVDSLVVADGRRYLVGTDSSDGTVQLGIWALHSDGSTQQIVLEGDAPSSNVSSSQAILHDGDIWIPGLHLGRAQAWKVSLADLAAASTDLEG